MSLLTIKNLQRLAIHCGYRTEITKSARLAAIADSSKFFDGLLSEKHSGPFNILSIDVGLKNFSYSKVSYHGNRAHIKDWTVINLHDEFGTPNYTDAGSLVDSKAYMARLAVSVVDNVLISGLWVPNVITIENQRTRSNSSKATLPNVLLNFTLEHMLYSAFAARQTTKKAYAQSVIVPMNANKMVNFWLSRYLAKSCYTPSKSKSYRKGLLYAWLKAPSSAPVDISDFTSLLPSNFQSMGATLLSESLRLALNITRLNTKTDDLVDSMLYNFGIHRQISNHEEMKDLLTAGEKNEIINKLDQWDRQHLCFLKPYLQENSNLSLSDEYHNISLKT